MRTRTWWCASLQPRTQVRLHVALLVASLLVLPIIPGATWKPSGTEQPAALILGLLGVTIGLPYFLLSTTSPLVQSWFARIVPGSQSVPAVRALQPRIDARPARLSVPARAVGADARAGVGLVDRVRGVRRAVRRHRVAPGHASAARVAAPRGRRATTPLRHRRSRFSSTGARSPPPARILLLAVSNHITQNIAAVPLLWVAPLAIYLLTFILCFEAPAGTDATSSSPSAAAPWRDGVDARRPRPYARPAAAARRVPASVCSSPACSATASSRR